MRSDDDAFLDEIPRGARLGAHDRPLMTDQAVEQAALAGIRRADDHGFDAGAQQFTVMARGQQPVGFRRE